MRWVGPDETINIAGYSVPGMIYLLPMSHPEARRTRGRGFIDAELPVSPVVGPNSVKRLSGIPSYYDLSPSERGAYLDWLCGERDNGHGDVPFAFLYFFGIERRFFVDLPPVTERQQLFVEVQRLYQAFRNVPALCSRLSAFLEAADMVFEHADGIDRTGGYCGPRELNGSGLPSRLQRELGRLVNQGLPLQADHLFDLYVNHPNIWLAPRLTGVIDEVRAYFVSEFNGLLPEGLQLPKPKQDLQFKYAAASGAFQVDLGRYTDRIPAVLESPTALECARLVMERTTVALERYTAFIERNPQRRGSVEAFLLMPFRITRKFPCTAFQDLGEWAHQVVGGGGETTFDNLLIWFGVKKGASPRKDQMIVAAEALGLHGIGMEPDPRFALRRPRPGDPVILFLPKGKAIVARDPGPKYRGTLLAIAAGCLVARQEGAFPGKARLALASHIDEAELTKTQRVRLQASLRWLLLAPLELPMLHRHLRDVSPEIRRVIEDLALAVAAVEEVVIPEQVAMIKAIYEKVSLPVQLVDDAIRARLPADRPVIVLPARSEQLAFTVPPAPKRHDGVELDDRRIASVRADTARVSTVLGAIFTDEEPEIATPVTAEPTGIPGLDSRHESFLRGIVAKDRWAEDELAALARQARLMQGGALETLNEWSFACYGDALIEEDDGYILNPDIVARLRKEGLANAYPEN